MNLSASKISTALRCGRLYDFHHNQRLRTLAPTDDALKMGTLVHAGLEAWNLALATSLGPHWRDAMHHAATKSDAPARDLNIARALIAGYSETWGIETTRKYHVIGVEVPFEIEVGHFDDGEPIVIRGKMDAVYRDRDTGELIVVEHKTKGGKVDDAAYWSAKKANNQVGMYYLAAEAHYGELPAGVLYDVIAKPGQKPYQATPPEKRRYKCDKRCKGRCQGHSDGTLYANQRERDETNAEFVARVEADVTADPAKYFRRETLVRLGDERERFEVFVLDMARLLRLQDDIGVHLPNTDRCHDFNRPCDFFAVCCGEADVDNQMLFRREPEEELEPQPEGALS